MTLQQKFEEARKKIRGPMELSAQRIFSSPDGKRLLDMLSNTFESGMLARDGKGGIDPNGTLVNVGASEVIKFLRELAEIKEDRT